MAAVVVNVCTDWELCVSFEGSSGVVGFGVCAQLCRNGIPHPKC